MAVSFATFVLFVAIHKTTTLQEMTMTNATNTPAPYMTKAEIARRLGVSRAMIWKMVKAGKFPAGHILNKWERWKRADIEAWCTARGI